MADGGTKTIVTMAAAESTEELLGTLTDKVKNKKQCITDKNTAADAATAEVSIALDAVLLRISSTPKEDLPEPIRCRYDVALVDLDGEVSALKRPFLNSLRRSGHYRAFLGLPRTLERVRRYFTGVSLKKAADILEGKKGLTRDIQNCTSPDSLQWVEPVLRQLSGEGRFKRDLEGFELSSPVKGKIRAVINIAKKHIKELEKKKNGGGRSGNSRTNAVPAVHMERDVRLVDQERRVAQSVGMEQMIDKASSTRKKREI